MRLITFFEMQMRVCVHFCKIKLQVHESKITFKLLYFQVDKTVKCMNIVFNFSNYGHDLSNCQCKSMLKNLNNQSI